MKSWSELNTPGRFCPLDYRFQPEVFARPAELRADTVLIAGGLYGNRAALASLLRLLEPDAMLVFAGDFNWFNAAEGDFREINGSVLAHVAMRGNVETELYAPNDNAGCGCSYPLSVDDSEVKRSNAIMMRLRQTASVCPELREPLAALPMHLVAAVGELTVGITHGDACSLAGWDFSHDALHLPDHQAYLHSLFDRARVDVFASSHTCLPALRVLNDRGAERAIINNGAAGMPNFSGTHYGIATRISIHACPPTIQLYGTRIGNVFVDAVKVHYDQRAFVEQFASTWPAGSPAYGSYFTRITEGPAFTVNAALGHPVRRPATQLAG